MVRVFPRRELWTLEKTIEVVILDNEEKSTTYTETGDTGLFLGEISLPASKTHQSPCMMAALTHESKQLPDGTAEGTICWRMLDGAVETIAGEWYINYSGSQDTYGFVGLVTGIDPTASLPHSYSLKGNPNMKLRFYLRGDPNLPDNLTYCRNLVVTVVPLYQ